MATLHLIMADGNGAQVQGRIHARTSGFSTLIRKASKQIRRARLLASTFPSSQSYLEQVCVCDKSLERESCNAVEIRYPQPY
jgi:hypothetical protein